MKEKTLLISLVLVLIASLVACAAPASTPAPNSAPAPAPAPTKVIWKLDTWCPSPAFQRHDIEIACQRIAERTGNLLVIEPLF